MNYIKVERTDDNIVKAITASALRCVTLRRHEDITQSDILLPIDDNRAKLWNEHVQNKLMDAEKEEQTRDRKNTIATEKAQKAAKQTGRHSSLANPGQYGLRTNKTPDVSCMEVVQGQTERLRNKLGTSYENDRIPGLFDKIRMEILNECNSPAERKAYKRDAFQNLARAHDAFMEDERGPWKCFRKALLDDYYEYADSDALPDQAGVNRNVVAFFRRQDGIINLGIKAEGLFLEAASHRDMYLYGMLPDFIRWDILSNWKLYEAIERENKDAAAGKDDEQQVTGKFEPRNEAGKEMKADSKKIDELYLPDIKRIANELIEQEGHAECVTSKGTAKSYLYNTVHIKLESKPGRDKPVANTVKNRINKHVLAEK